MRLRMMPTLMVALLVVVMATVALAGGKTALSTGAKATGTEATDAKSTDEVAGKVFGKGVSAADTTLVSELLGNPEHYLGETVRVQGPVVGCCKKRGCWIEIASDQEYQTVMLKVNDGEIVFPMEVIGETAIVEGVFEGVPMGYDQACAYLEHEAECQGKKFDKKEVPTEGITFYRIKGTGAVVLTKDS